MIVEAKLLLNASYPIFDELHSSSPLTDDLTMEDVLNGLHPGQLGHWRYVGYWQAGRLMSMTLLG